MLSCAQDLVNLQICFFHQLLNRVPVLKHSCKYWILSIFLFLSCDKRNFIFHFCFNLQFQFLEHLNTFFFVYWTLVPINLLAWSYHFPVFIGSFFFFLLTCIFLCTYHLAPNLQGFFHRGINPCILYILQIFPILSLTYNLSYYVYILCTQKFATLFYYDFWVL